MPTNNSRTIENGLVFYNSTVVGAVAVYQCDSGYSLSGSVQRICQCDGSWNDSVPVCTAPIQGNPDHDSLLKSLHSSLLHFYVLSPDHTAYACFSS